LFNNAAICQYRTVSGLDEGNVRMDHRLNESDRGKPKYPEKNMSHCYLVHNKYNRDWPAMQTGLPLWQAGEP